MNSPCKVRLMQQQGTMFNNFNHDRVLSDHARRPFTESCKIGGLKLSDQNLPEDKAQKVAFASGKLKSASCRLEKSLSVNATVIQAHSKIVSQNASSDRSEFSSIENHFKNTRWKETESPENGLTWESKSLSFYDLNKNSNVKSPDCSKVERILCKERIVGDAMYSSPWELVEIYSGKEKHKDSDNVKNESSQKTLVGAPMRSFPQEGDNSTKFEILKDRSLSPRKKCDNIEKDSFSLHSNNSCNISTKQEVWKEKASSLCGKNNDFTQPTRDQDDCNAEQEFIASSSESTEMILNLYKRGNDKIVERLTEDASDVNYLFKADEDLKMRNPYEKHDPTNFGKPNFSKHTNAIKMIKKNETYVNKNCETQQENIDHCNINACNVLMEVHAQLMRNWQKWEKLRMSLESSVPVISITSTIMIQLLGKTIARCKSYVHSSDNSDAATAKMNKLLSKYVVTLMNAVNEDTVDLEKQELQYKRKPTHEQYYCKSIVVPSTRNLVSTDMDPISSNRKNSISNLIQIISSLTGDILAENEEKENVKSSRKFKSNYQRANFSGSNTRRRNGTLRTKNTKLTPVKKDSSIETQMSMNAKESVNRDKSKGCIAAVTSPIKNREREKMTEEAQCNASDKKCRDNNLYVEKGKSKDNQWRPPVPRQKHRVSNTVQPVWKPAGIVRIPSSGSATSLIQKSRPSSWTCGKEKINSESKQRRAKTGFVKNVSTDAHSTARESHPYLENEGSKALRKKSATSLSTGSKFKQKLGVPKSLTKQFDEPPHLSSEFTSLKKCENASRDKMTGRLNGSRESEIIQILKETIKSIPASKRGESRSIKEGVKINEEEPTRDVGKNELTNDRRKVNEAIGASAVDQKLLQEGEGILEGNKIQRDVDPSSFANISEKILDSGINPKGGNLRNDCGSDVESNFVSSVNASCVTEFGSHSCSAIRRACSNCCHTSLNTHSSSSTSSDQGRCYRTNETLMKNMANTPREFSIVSNGDPARHDEGKWKKPKGSVNNHALWLNMLKEFLCCQGVDIDLIQRAEREVKGKYRNGRKGIKRKSVVFGHSINIDDKKAASLDPFVDHRTDVAGSAVQDNTRSKINLNGIDKSSQTENVDNKENVNYRRSSCSLQTSLQFKATGMDKATCTVNSGKDVSSQTGFLWETCGSSQTNSVENVSSIKLEAREIQTEMSSVRHVGTECMEKLAEKGVHLNESKRSSACLMTQTIPNLTGERSTETLRVAYSSKSVITDEAHRGCTNKLITTIERPRANSASNVSEKSTNTFNEEVEEKMINDDRRSMKKCYCDIKKLLSRICENREIRYPSNYRKNVEEDELHFLKSRSLLFSSSSSAVFSEYSENCPRCYSTLSEESNAFSGKNIPSDTKTAFCVASRTACRVNDSQKSNMEERIFEKDSDVGTESKIRSNGEKRRMIGRNSSSTSISDLERNFQNSVKVSKFTIKNISPHLDVECRNFRKESKIDTLRFSGTSETINFASSNKNISREVDMKKSYSDAVLRDVKSLMEFLLCRAEDKKYDNLRCVRKGSNTNGSSSTYFEFHEEETVDRNCFPTYSVLSRESLLPLVYGILCSIVFWCLQFSIKCDVNEMHGL